MMTETAVDEGIDAAVGGAEPLSKRRKVVLQEVPLIGRQRRPDQNVEVNAVERQPGECEYDKDDGQHQ